MSSEELDLSLVNGWLQPLADPAAPCGKDLEYDNEFLALSKAVEGKPETQFGPGEPPNWRDVRELSGALFARTRDLRIALLWVRAGINLNGFSAFPTGLRLIEGLLENFWDQLHPLPDPEDGDPYARVNALAILPQADGLLGDLRQCVFFSIRGLGELRLRAIEIGLGQMSARPDEIALTKAQLVQMIASAIKQDPALREQPQAALTGLKTLASLMNERFGVAIAPDLRPLVNLIKSFQGLLPLVSVDANEESGNLADAVESVGNGARLLGNVQSRDDAVRAIDMICEYLDRTEPTNPAQLMLRRARRLINQNFLQLMKELAPDALNEVARVMGVNPDSVTLEN